MKRDIFKAHLRKNLVPSDASSVDVSVKNEQSNDAYIRIENAERFR